MCLTAARGGKHRVGVDALAIECMDGWWEFRSIKLDNIKLFTTIVRGDILFEVNLGLYWHAQRITSE